MKHFFLLIACVFVISGCSAWDKSMDSVKSIIEIAPAIVDDVKEIGDKVGGVFDKSQPDGDGEPVPETPPVE